MDELQHNASASIILLKTGIAILKGQQWIWVNLSTNNFSPQQQIVEDAYQKPALRRLLERQYLDLIKWPSSYEIFQPTIKDLYKPMTLVL